MRRTRRVVAALAMLPAAAALLAQTAPQTAPQPASISGTVNNAVTGEPILRAHVSVRCMSQDPQQGQQSYGALTNEKGEFTIAPLPPGTCPVWVERVGFVPPRNSESYALSSGLHKNGVKLTLIPTGAITGRVLNAAGEPAEAVGVSVEPDGGASSNATSDDKGQFRIGGLRPGKYRVKATPQSLPFPPEIRSDGAVEPHDAATFYPDSLSAKTAQRLEVKAGADVSGVDIRLVQTPIVKVSGKVDGIPQGAKNVNVRVMPSGMGTSPKPDGTFEIWRLDPGKYTLQAQNWGQSQLMSAPVEIEVTTANVENVELRMIPAFEVAGQLRFDDEQARAPAKPPARPDGSSPPPPPPQPRRVELHALDQQYGQMANATVGDDDSFTLQKVQPARYRVVITWGTGYVKSLRAGETEVDGDILDVRNGAAGPLTVNVSSNFCEVSGTVSDSNGPVSDTTVALQSAEDPTNVRWGQTNSSGVFRVQTPPGKYRLAAVEQSALSWGMQGPDLEEYEPENLDLSAGDKVAKDLMKRK